MRIGFTVMLLGSLLGGGCGGAASWDPTAEYGEDGAPSAIELTGIAPEELRVLFVGNSYTQSGNLPRQFAQRMLTLRTRPHLIVDAHIVTGRTLEGHYNDLALREKIRTGGFTHVVLQGRSVEPVQDSVGFQKHAKLLGDLVHEAGAVPVYFQTWARLPGDPVYAEPWSGGTPEELQARLRRAYRYAARVNRGVYAPAGDAWEIALADADPPALHGPDGAHPGMFGTFLNACVFVNLFCQAVHDDVTPPESIPPPVADELQQAAARIFVK